MIDPKSASDDLPELNDPVVVVAFEGWNDAGDAATGAVEHLELIWDAEPLAALDPEDYYDFQVNRPTVSLVERRQPAHRVADHPDLGGPAAGQRPATSSSSAASSRTCAGAASATSSSS